MGDMMVDLWDLMMADNWAVQMVEWMVEWMVEKRAV
jgi:hypothetical protein